MANNILIIGYFGFKTNQLDGQTIKTRNVYELIKRNYSHQDKVNYLDTEEIKTSPIKAIYNLFVRPIAANKIVYLPGETNLNKYFLFLYTLSKFTRKEIIYPVVGGWLPQFLKNNKRLSTKLKKIKVLLVETERMKIELESMGFDNINMLENFRITDFIPSTSKPIHNFNFVFMARIRRDKGCDIIFEAVNKLQSQTETKFDIDFYGGISENYKSEFLAKVEKSTNIHYKGIVQPSDVYNTLSKYDCLLLPTYYDGEGFPGSIVEAYISGIPVIVSDWKDLATFVEEEKTGFIIPPRNSNALEERMRYLLTNPNLIPILKKNILKEANKFSETNAWKVIGPLILS